MLMKHGADNPWYTVSEQRPDDDTATDSTTAYAKLVEAACNVMQGKDPQGKVEPLAPEGPDAVMGTIRHANEITHMAFQGQAAAHWTLQQTKWHSHFKPQLQAICFQGAT